MNTLTISIIAVVYIIGVILLREVNKNSVKTEGDKVRPKLWLTSWLGIAIFYIVFALISIQDKLSAFDIRKTKFGGRDWERKELRMNTDEAVVGRDAFGDDVHAMPSREHGIIVTKEEVKSHLVQLKYKNFMCKNCGCGNPIGGKFTSIPICLDCKEWLCPDCAGQKCFECESKKNRRGRK